MKLQAPKVVTIGILTLITLVFAVGFEVFRVFTKEPPPVVPKEVIEPLNPVLDADSLDKLQGRIQPDISGVSQVIQTQPTPAPVIEVAPTTEPTSEPIPVSTDSGTLDTGLEI